MASRTPWHDAELLAFDLETTGVDRFDDVPVSFALVTMRRGRVVGEDAAIVDPGREVPAGAAAVHGITTERARREGLPLDAAVCRIVEAVLGASRRGVPIVGMKLDFDLTMIDSCWRRQSGRGLNADGFRGPVLDALVLDRYFDRYRRGRRTLADLCAHYGVAIERAHDAAADAKAAGNVVIAMSGRFRPLLAAGLGDLHLAQQRWHREWATSFSEWRVRKGLPCLDEHDADWPIACVGGPVSPLEAAAV